MNFKQFIKRILGKDKNNLTDKACKKNLTAQVAEKSIVHIIVEILEYMPSAVVSKTIVKWTSGNFLTLLAADEELAEKNRLIIPISDNPLFPKWKRLAVKSKHIKLF